MVTGPRAEAFLPRNIVLCCDGTKNEFGVANTNVIKLYSVLDHADPQQTSYYHPGLGSMGSPYALTAFERVWTKAFGLAFGYGLSEHLADLYAVLMSRYQPDDQLYVFGFSRGAYTARALCAMLHVFGLIRCQDTVLVPYSIRLMKAYSRGQNARVAERFRETFSSLPVNPRFVGVWDTVSSVGAVYTPLKLPYTAFNPDIVTGRHAVSIDERRAFFRQNLWSVAPHQDIQQVWFPGVHCDVGGGYAEPESGLSKIALEWMICEAAKAGLRVVPSQVDLILGRSPYSPYAKPDPTAKLHDSLGPLWWPAEIIPRFPYNHASGKRSFEIPLGRRRFIPQGSWVHESVYQRWDSHIGYHPRNLYPEHEKYRLVRTDCSRAAGA